MLPQFKVKNNSYPGLTIRIGHEEEQPRGGRSHDAEAKENMACSEERTVQRRRSYLGDCSESCQA